MKTTDTGSGAETPEVSNFIRSKVEADLAAGRHHTVVTRFPPEPNGWPHIGHAKSICLNFGLAQDFGGVCHLRMDDTNPTTEDISYVEAIQRDIKWLGFDWADKMFYASDYFEAMYQYAVKLIRDGNAYVCPLTEEEMRAYRGSVTERGKDSPGRLFTVEQNLDLFERMRRGEFPEGKYTLRARMDMGHPNMKMRDAPLYRIRFAHHYRTGDAWCIYPMYDYAHPISDAIEGITHSICTLEFENNRDIYDWVIDRCDTPAKPRQTEFARLNLTYTLISKRYLLALVEKGLVSGWDDPRMPTLAGLRRRGVTPRAIRDLCDKVGVAKANSVVDFTLLEGCIRDDLNTISPRAMAVLRPLKVVIENWDEGHVERLDAPSFPAGSADTSSRSLPFGREIYIERDDFMEEPSPGFFRLVPGGEVRLRYAYIIKCVGVVKDSTGTVTELRCTYDPSTRSGEGQSRKVKGTLHWVPAGESVEVEVRLYDRLFKDEFPTAEDLSSLNPGSLTAINNARIEPHLATAKVGEPWQFERLGFFVLDPDSSTGHLVFNRTIGLKDSWSKGPDEVKPAPRVPPREAKTLPRDTHKATPALSEEQKGRLELLLAAGVGESEATILCGDPDLITFFQAGLAVHPNPRGLANWMVNDLMRELKGQPLSTLPVTGPQLASLVKLLDEGVITGVAAKQVFEVMVVVGGEPESIVDHKGLRLIEDPAALLLLIDQVITHNPSQVQKYREGRTNLLGFFVGQVVKETGGKVNPQKASELIKDRLR